MPSIHLYWNDVLAITTFVQSANPFAEYTFCMEPELPGFAVLSPSLT